MSSQTKLARLEVRVEQLEEDNRNLIRKLELAEEALRVERRTQHAVARNRSWGNGVQQ